MLQLKELSNEIGQAEYEMYQDIPLLEDGSTNLCNGLSYNAYKDYIKNEIKRKNIKIDKYDTPTITYLLYEDNYPIGYVGIRTTINEEWRKIAGNVYYAIRKKERKKGYGTIILYLALEECKKRKMKRIYCQASENNIASNKVIIKNKGILIENRNGKNYYYIDV